MGSPNRLGEIFTQNGHVYVTKLGYVSIEIYSADVTLMDYVQQTIGGTVKSHLRVRKVGIYSRAALRRACGILLSVGTDLESEAQLRLVLEYTAAETPAARSDAITELRQLLSEEREHYGGYSEPEATTN